MALKVLTPAPYQRLVSLSAYRAETGDTATADARVLRMLASTARAFEGYLGWPLPRQRYQETFSGNGRQRLITSARPVDRDSIALTIDDIALEADAFLVEDAAQGVLFRRAGWLPRCSRPGEEGEASIAATFKAGWVVPESIRAYPAADGGAQALTLGEWIRPSSSLSPYLLEVTVAGLTGEPEPAWGDVTGVETEDGTAKLTLRDAVELPGDIYEVAIITARLWLEGMLDQRVGIQYEKADGFEVGYDFVGLREAISSLPPFAKSVLESYR